MSPDVAGPRRLAEVLAAGAAWLARRAVDQPRLACELLAAQALGTPRLRLLLEGSRELSDDERLTLRGGLRRLAAGEPLQHVLGEWDFRGRTLGVDRRALVPRPETEQLVQLVLDTPALWATGRSPRIVDVGTGGGCIVISLAVERPQGHYLAIEPEPGARDLARANAARHGVADRILFRPGEGCEGIEPATLDAVVSNPPYIATAEIAALPPVVRDHDPHRALDGGADGLTVIRSVAHDAALALRPDGWLFLEIGATQGAAVRDLLEPLGFVTAQVLPDFSGRDRLVRARLTAGAAGQTPQPGSVSA